MALYYFDTQVCPTRPFTMACLWPIPVMDLYINQGQVYCYMDFFWASLGWTFLQWHRKSKLLLMHKRPIGLPIEWRMQGRDSEDERWRRCPLAVPIPSSVVL